MLEEKILGFQLIPITIGMQLYYKATTDLLIFLTQFYQVKKLNNFF